MNRQNKHIGVTLLFYKKEKEKYHAIMSSYIFLLNTYKSFVFDVEKTAKKLLMKEFCDFTFAGIADLYIAEKEGNGRYLGRTSFFEKKQIQEAKEIILKNNAINKILSENPKEQKYNIGLVYFNNDSEGIKFNSTIIIYSQLRNIENFEQILKLANNKNFKKKIIKFSIEQLKLEDLQYVGIIDFYPIKHNGLFAVEKSFNDISNINEEIISVSELRKKFNEVLKDYKHLG